MISLPKKIKDEITDHALREMPNEACGILAGAGNEAKKIYRMANMDKSAVSYFMEPKQQLAVMKEIREAGLKMLAIYHSHPNVRAYPSSRDVELAFYPDVSYLIISIMKAAEPVMKSFRIEEGKVREEEITVI